MEVRCPVIFTTAYDQYALQAFKVNSVDYLLKPIDEDELSAALRKLRQPCNVPAAPAFDPALLTQLVQQMQQAPPASSYKTQFVVRVGEHLKVVPSTRLPTFSASKRPPSSKPPKAANTWWTTPWTSSKTLLDPRRFFRLNRAYLAQQSAIQDIIHYTNSRLQTVLKPTAPDTQVLVSREKVSVFKSWLDR